MKDGYESFLAGKARRAVPCGFEPRGLNPALFGFQRDVVRWACRKGKAAVFADCGLGKTLVQLEWARQVCGETGGRVLVLAPLAVARQTVREGEKFGIPCRYVRSADEVEAGISVANYEMLHALDPDAFAGVVLDESSILKSYSSATRNDVVDAFAATPYRLACTATPSPNDHEELGNHSEFLGVMTRAEMLAMFFVHDGGDTAKWRIKGHAAERFWDWVATWAVMLRSPADLGYPAEGFDLPPLSVERHVVDSGIEPASTLFNVPARTLSGLSRARRDTVAARCAAVAGLVNASDAPWVVWCERNDESALCAASIPGAVEVRGSDSPESKEDAMIGFADGRCRVLVTKPSICGFGMNWQHCADMAFVGMSHSYEQFYQAVRRCWRYGQERPVTAHVVSTDLDGAVFDNVMRKSRDAEAMAEKMVARTSRIREGADMTSRDEMGYAEAEAEGDGWRLLLGDCVERMSEIGDGSVGFSVFSPPFASLYTYSNSDRDMGNCRTDGEFMEHLSYLVPEIYRVLAPGRLVSFHCMNLPTSKERDGYIGIRDFRGDLIRAFQAAGFIYHSEVTIWKDPVTAMHRTKALGLLNKQKNKDSALSRQGIPDYLVTMRKPGDNAAPIRHTDAEFPIPVWQRLASPVWMDVDPSDTLQYRSARANGDERHICPLQLGVINRALDLWSRPGDLVLSPFAGIGSEGHCALLKGRRFVGIELKRSYFARAARNLAAAAGQASALTVADFLEVSA